MSKKYRIKVSPNGLQKSAFEVITGIGAIYRTITGVGDIREGFEEENRRHRRRKAKAVRRLFK